MSRFAGTIAIRSKLQSTFRAFPGFLFTLAGSLLAAILLYAPATNAQVSASISGRVTDPTGAIVSTAAVVAKNVETGITRSTVTDEAGLYWVPSLTVGEYEVHVTKQGFQEQVRSGIHLVVGQQATVDVALQVGQVTEQVKVSADAPVVSVTPTDISGLVGEQQIKDLPLNGRSYDELMTLNPAVITFTSEKTGGIGVSNSTNANMFSVAGNRPQQNLFLLNGIEFTGAAENNMTPGGTSGQMLGVDAVREFNLLSNSFGAEYGKHPGGQVTIVTTSGTNQWHGSLFEYLRNNVFDAPNFFDLGSAPPFRRNQFGGAIGGPIQKDKTFVFANYEGLRESLHQTSVAFVPDAAARSGAFVPLGSACTVPNQVACAAEVTSLLNLWPVANGPDQGSGIAIDNSNPLRSIREDFGTARVDHNFSDKDSFDAVYTIDDSVDQDATAINPFMSDFTSLREQVVSLEETHVVSPSFLNTARFGFSRAGYFFTGEPTPGTPAATVAPFLNGIPFIGAVVVGGSAASNPAAQVALAGSNNGSNLNLHRNLFTYEDQIAWTKGRHQFKFGAWFQRFQSNENIALSQYGQATFPNLTNFLSGTFGTGSFLIDPASTPLSWRSLFGAIFAEDVIRVSPSFTLSLGYRQEFSTGWNEAYGRASNYTFTNGVINTQPVIGSSVFTQNNAWFLPQPRIGLAWSPIGSKTVIRAGAGIYNDLQDALGYRTDQNAPFNATYTIPNLTLNKFPLSPNIVPVSAGTASPAGTKIAPGGVDPNMKTPTVYSYSLKIEQEITSNTSISVGYIGAHGSHELISVDANIPTQVVCPASPCPGSLPAGTIFNTSTTRQNGSLANTYSWFSEGDSMYNAMTVDVRHRFSHGLTFRGAYTWSNALDDGDSLNATAAANAPALVQNPLNVRGDWGPATYDVRNAGVMNVSYELPFGHGRQMLNSVSGWENNVVGGWILNSIVTIQSGFPFTPQLSFNPSNDGDSKNPVRPSWNPSFTGPVILGGTTQWFNPAAFIVPPSGTFGNVGRNVLTGPGLGEWDFSVLKDTHLFERMNLQFRAEIFNLLNRTNLNTPNLITFTSATVGTPPTPAPPSPVAGTFTQTSTTSRQVQFSLKLLW
ncbi:MAG TPA: carboxypeptidase regulatory-like domain-containing protein [Candidatus Saccharimonadales bacterium]|nr:carboxypeptidase regulatory-like domain-containing protein [Candidatus Saccharimonadales bacterium]